MNLTQNDRLPLVLSPMSRKWSSFDDIAVWTNWTPGVHTVFFEGCYIVYNGNKRRTKL